MAFSEDQLERYSRHFVLPGVGVSGQKKLLQSKVLVVGAGALGSPALLYLAAAGVGTLGIADDDRVDLSNLQRQIIHRRHKQIRVTVAAKLLVIHIMPLVEHTAVFVADAVALDVLLALFADDVQHQIPYRRSMQHACAALPVFLFVIPLDFVGYKPHNTPGDGGSNTAGDKG